MRNLTARIATSCLIVFLGACGGSSGGNSVETTPTSPITSSPTSISGSVGDGPVVNATVKFFDANGLEIGEAISNGFAKYEFELPANTQLPVTIRATGGMDLVTGRTLDFELVSFVNDADQSTVNISPITTLEFHAANCLNGASSISAAKKSVADNASMGLGESDLQFVAVGPENVAAVVKANEAVGEVVRRVANGSPDSSAQDVVEQFGCDLADGAIDGSGSSNDSVAALLHANIATVSVESLANALKVDGTDALARMDAAIAAVEPSANDMTSDVLPSNSGVDQLQNSLTVLNTAVGDDAISDIQALLISTPSESLPAVLKSKLANRELNAIEELPARFETASESESAVVSDAATSANSAPEPTVVFSSNATPIDAGDSLTLSWVGENSDQCVTSGDWSETIATSGSHTIADLNVNAQFGITCIGLGGVVADSVTVLINQPATTSPGAPPASPSATVSITASSIVVTRGGALELQWSSTNVTSCAAEGNWSGVKARSGRQTVQNITGTSVFRIKCVGATSQALDSVTVQIQDITVAPAAPATPTPTPKSAAPTTPTPTPTPTPAAPSSPSQGNGNVTVQLNAASPWIASAGSTQLTWSSEDASGCQASGDWSGNKSLSGTETVRSLTEDKSYTLNCSSGSENAVAITTVAIRQARFSWNVPTTKADGSTLSNLAGYRLYWGTTSGKYTQTVQINNPQARSHVLALNPDTYYFAFVSVDSSGAESTFSNELSKVVR